MTEMESGYSCSYTTSDDIDAEAFNYRFDIRINGLHQGFNAAIAVKAIRVFQAITGLEVPVAAISDGIRSTSIPCRIESFDTSPKVILDGGHNIESMMALTRYLEARNKSGLTLVFGVLSDKNYRRMIELLLPFIDQVILTLPQSERALAPGKIKKYFKGSRHLQSVLIENNPADAYRAACAFNNEILITGSFYLAGIMREMVMNTSRRV
jgi:dihydrofolate synthase/folylpolyglutamate synthase